jgi:hypothetical protein
VGGSLLRRLLVDCIDAPRAITVEFYGIPRQRAGRAELAVQADSIAELLRCVQLACPGLDDLVEANGKLSPRYLISIDGMHFIMNERQRLEPGARVLILSADAGG